MDQFDYHGTAVLTRPHDLPEFQRPPVTEVLLSLQFGTLSKLRSYHIGLLWETIRDRYPTVTEQGEISPNFETFGSSGLVVQQPRIQFETLIRPPMPRYWFEAPDGSLMQVQQDRLIHNWRKQEESDEYPRYEKVREEFTKDLSAFDKFLRDQDLGDIRPNQSEITYINTIVLPDDTNPQVALDRVVTIWKGVSSSITKFESATIQLRSVLKVADEPYARMHVAIQPAVRVSNQAPVIRMDMTVRGKPPEANVSAAIAFFDTGREAIVRSFTDLTTPEMHEVWGRTK